MSTVSPYRKLVAELLAKLVLLLTALSVAGADTGGNVAQFIIAVASVVGVFLLANSANHPAAKLGASVLGVAAAYIAYGITAEVAEPWGWDITKGGGVVTILGLGLLGSAITYLTPNDTTASA
jgi:hypothetical protein